jgi:hypothetical protein
MEELSERRKCPSEKERDKSRESDRIAVLHSTNPFGASPEITVQREATLVISEEKKAVPDWSP